MCGIVGYTGTNGAKEKILSGLRRLEYRGYDSAGLSVFNSEGKITTYKTKGRIANLEAIVKGKEEDATCGIGHTRWATHGVPSDANAHPHTTPKLTLVHNGIIENYLEIRNFLTGKGYDFVSETDTEIAAKLLDFFYDNDPIKAIKSAVEMIDGAYAFAIMFQNLQGELFAIRKDSPLVVTKSDDGLFFASDMPAVLEFTNRYYTIEPLEIAHLSDKNEEKFYTLDGKEVKKEIIVSNLSFEQAEKGGFEHFMLKEIYEQPSALERTLKPRVSKDFMPDFTSDKISDDFFDKFDFIHIIACGTACYAGSIGAQVLGRLAKINVSTCIASEFRYTPPIFGKRDLAVFVSQSGETADTLAALKLAKQNNVLTLALVNVAGSAIALEADYVIYTHAGPEIAVASTKGFSVQMGTFYLLAIKAAFARGKITKDEAQTLTKQLLETVSEVETTFSLNEQCLDISKTYLDASSMFYIGRGQDSVLSLEGALKLKEISYIHCEAYAAGELKHGTISLITEQTPIIALVTDKRLAPKTISNMKEVKARGGKITVVTLKGMDIPEDSYELRIDVDCKHHLFAPMLAIIPLQLLAYHTSCLKGCDVDKPRNLAKSVTVE